MTRTKAWTLGALAWMGVAAIGAAACNQTSTSTGAPNPGADCALPSGQKFSIAPGDVNAAPRQDVPFTVTLNGQLDWPNVSNEGTVAYSATAGTLSVTTRTVATSVTYTTPAQCGDYQVFAEPTFGGSSSAQCKLVANVHVVLGSCAPLDAGPDGDAGVVTPPDSGADGSPDAGPDGGGACASVDIVDVSYGNRGSLVVGADVSMRVMGGPPSAGLVMGFTGVATKVPWTIVEPPTPGTDPYWWAYFTVPAGAQTGPISTLCNGAAVGPGGYPSLTIVAGTAPTITMVSDPATRGAAFNITGTTFGAANLPLYVTVGPNRLNGIGARFTTTSHTATTGTGTLPVTAPTGPQNVWVYGSDFSQGFTHFTGTNVQ